MANGKLLGITVTFYLAACQSGSILCPGGIVPPIVVEVRDADTGAPAAQGAGGTIRKGDYVAQLKSPTPTEQLVLISAGDAGTYDVLVQKPTYVDWRKNGVVVEGGQCGVQKEVVLRASLQRAP